MQSHKNQVIIATAGSGKTTRIVDEALKVGKQRVLITTYTNENLEQIQNVIIDKAGYIPSNISVRSWFSFLLQDGVRPYQNHVHDKGRVRSIFFPKKPLRYHKKDDYLTCSNDIYSDKVSEFVYECHKKSNGLITRRLEKIYDWIFIDELQDFAGYDLNFLEILFESAIHTFAVGDPRQATYSTNNAKKNSQHKKSNIYMWLKQKESAGQIAIEEMHTSHRCNQCICDFADKLYPELPTTLSKNNVTTTHDGIFRIAKEDVNDYIKTHKPEILIYNKKTDTTGLRAINIGMSKGRTYNRVLIFPTKPMLEYLKTEDLSKAGDKTKLYVAVTRARYSVAFVVEDGAAIRNNFLPSSEKRN